MVSLLGCTAARVRAARHKEVIPQIGDLDALRHHEGVKVVSVQTTARKNSGVCEKYSGSHATCRLRKRSRTATGPTKVEAHSPACCAFGTDRSGAGTKFQRFAMFSNAQTERLACTERKSCKARMHEVTFLCTQSSAGFS
jgi:hypothetical protein